MLVSGNPNFGLAQSLHKLYPDAEFCSRANGYDLCNSEHQTNFAQRALDHNVVVVSSALWKFNQTLRLPNVEKLTNQWNHFRTLLQLFQIQLKLIPSCHLQTIWKQGICSRIIGWTNPKFHLKKRKASASIISHGCNRVSI